MSALIIGSYSQCNAMYEQLILDDADIIEDQEGKILPGCFVQLNVVTAFSLRLLRCFGLDVLDDMNEAEEDDAFSDNNNQNPTQSKLISFSQASFKNWFFCYLFLARPPLTQKRKLSAFMLDDNQGKNMHQSFVCIIRDFIL